VRYIRARIMKEDNLIGESHRSRIPERRTSVEVELPVIEMEGKCNIDSLYERRQTESRNKNATSTMARNIDVDYWFAIATTASNLTDLTLFSLHQYIFTSLDESNIWCTATSDSSSLDSNITSVSRLGAITFTPSELSPSNDRTFAPHLFRFTFKKTIST
jgi:hypothetical protein